MGTNPEEILAKEALSMPNRTAITMDKEASEGHMDRLYRALRHRMKEGLLEKPTVLCKTV